MIRWLHLIRYPDGADKQAGEEWYLDTHVPEALRMADHGLAGYRTWQALQTPYDSPYFSRERMNHWDRVTELCFDDFDGFRRATASNAGVYTPAPFTNPAGAATFEEHSIFLAEQPQHDFLRDWRRGR
jgi:hypothetical protein